jgi:hypothetical protein
MSTQQDDVPLYIFDEAWADEGRETAVLLDEYQVPPFFSEDLFKYVCVCMYVCICVCVCVVRAVLLDEYQVPPFFSENLFRYVYAYDL